ncbi:hypothetical protein ScalyP_jg9738 [Parmales sp. scaly parma]|nr:hypothetical protein ScalyP_jg9738 [Parmales sp. scaly parma]
MATEEFATDSFENLLFSIARFHEITNRYPEKITVVSFTFKERRFTKVHGELALRWPLEKISFVGVDPPSKYNFDLEKATKGELENSLVPYLDDLFGCRNPILTNKRASRNPFFVTPSYQYSNPEIAELIQFCGDSSNPQYTKELPWYHPNLPPS